MSQSPWSDLPSQLYDAITGLKADNMITWVIAAYILGLCGLGVRIYFWGKADDKRRAQLAAEAERQGKLE